MDHRQGVVGFSACKKWEPTDPSFDCNHEEEEKVSDVAYGIQGWWLRKHEKSFSISNFTLAKTLIG